MGGGGTLRGVLRQSQVCRAQTHRPGSWHQQLVCANGGRWDSKGGLEARPGAAAPKRTVQAHGTNSLGRRTQMHRPGSWHQQLVCVNGGRWDSKGGLEAKPGAAAPKRTVQAHDPD
eukprot:364907-Chlamydomonas_euryale.AAC.3